MGHNSLSLEQKKRNTDIWVIVSITAAVLAVYLVFQRQFNELLRNKEIPVLIRLLPAALTQFGLTGLGITVVCIMRKQSFFTYGLKAKNCLQSILLCVLCFVPYIIYTIATKQWHGYFPFQTVSTTAEIIAGGIPVNVIGMLVTALVWGFFEGFNYVVISDIVNELCPSKNRFLNWGAIICAGMCLLIHGAIGVTPEALIEMVTIIIIVYGMLMVRRFTDNAWGCVFIFVFLWNAL